MTTTNIAAPATTNGQQVPTRKSKVDVLKTIMGSGSVQEQFKNALKDNSGPFVASVIDLYNGDSYLQECDPSLVVMECLKAATLKLPINKNLGFAFIVPYKKKGVSIPQFQIGYKGLIQLALRTGQYRIIHADKVFEGEFRSLNKLTGEFDLSGAKTSDKLVGYFAHIEMLNGFTKTLYMTVEQVRAHGQKYSKSYAQEFSPWKTEFDGMAIKTVLRGLLGHYGFLSVEMIGAFDNDTDVADRIADDVRNGANKEPIGFDEAELVPEGNGHGGKPELSTNGQAVMGGPGF